MPWKLCVQPVQRLLAIVLPMRYLESTIVICVQLQHRLLYEHVKVRYLRRTVYITTHTSTDSDTMPKQFSQLRLDINVLRYGQQRRHMRLPHGLCTTEWQRQLYVVQPNANHHHDHDHNDHVWHGCRPEPGVPDGDNYAVWTQLLERFNKREHHWADGW